MLRDLNAIPEELRDRKALLMASTGLVLHEVGHIIVLALTGIPADYLIVDETPNAKRCGTYTHPRYYDVLARDVLAQIRIAAAGFAAEELIFGAALLNRSEDDLRCIASLLNMRFTEPAMPSIARCAQDMCGPIIPVSATEIVRATYAKVVVALESRRYLIDGANMVPFHAFRHPELPISCLHQLTAAMRTYAGRGRTKIIATLRSRAHSGL
jgi:hypothetical protein